MALGTHVPITFTGQVERDSAGSLWAVVYRGDQVMPTTLVAQESVRSLRQGKRRVTDMSLALADASLELHRPAGVA